MAEVWITLGFGGVAAIAYVLRLEGEINRLKDADRGLKEILEIHLANIDQRLERIEKKVLNGH